jgi:hypothetical protein
MNGNPALVEQADVMDKRHVKVTTICLFMFMLMLMPPMTGAAQPANEPVASKDDELKSAREAEREFHKAIDAWPGVVARGDDPGETEKNIRTSYVKYIDCMLRAGESPNAALLVPGSFAFAGTVTSTPGTTYSVMIGRGQQGIMVSVWSRNTTGQPLMGVESHARLPRRSRDAINVQHAQVAREASRTVFRIPYVLDARQGVFEIHYDGQRWTMRPDVGRVENGLWLMEK